MKTLQFFLTVLISSVAIAQTRIVVRPDATVSGAVIRLKDIATISGPKAREIDTMEVGKNSAPGTSRFILRDELFLFSSVPSEIRNSLLVEGEARCRVVSAHRDVTLAMIENQLRNLISEKLIWSREDCTITFRGDSTEVIARIAPQPYSLRLGELRSSELKGSALIPVIIDQGDFRERFAVQAWIAVTADVFVAQRRLDPGEELSLSDCIRKREDITLMPTMPFTEFIPGERYRVKSGVIGEGSTIMKSRVERKPLIEAGQTVSIKTTVGNATLAIVGVARQSGNRGDRIAVENVRSKKIVRGIIIEPGVVRVDQGGGA